MPNFMKLFWGENIINQISNKAIMNKARKTILIKVNSLREGMKNIKFQLSYSDLLWRHLKFGIIAISKKFYHTGPWLVLGSM